MDTFYSVVENSIEAENMNRLFVELKINIF